MKTGDPVKVEVFLGGKSRGFTPGTRDGYLIVETTQSGKYEWYAKSYGTKVDSGTSSGVQYFDCNRLMA
jgi:hypothetical protein